MDAQAIAPAEVADPLEPYRRWAIADADRQRINVAVGVLVVANVLPYLVGPVPQ